MLEIKQLKFRYDNVPESKEMCFDLGVNSGEILSIIGASGSGKSTLLNLVAGYNQQSSGEIIIEGKDIGQLAVAERPVTTVFQEHNLFPHLDVFTNVAIGLKPSLKLNNDETEQVTRALESVDLADLNKRLPGKLSGGQRQRVALARVLVRKQKILLLDEPLAALGPAMREEIIELIKILVTDNNMTALFVSHQPSDALLASKNCAFIYEGRVLELAKSDDLLSNSSHQEIKEYLGV